MRVLTRVLGLIALCPCVLLAQDPGAEHKPKQQTAKQPVAELIPGAPNDRTYLDYQVDKQATVAVAEPAKYPEDLRRAGVQGSVMVQFVVDTSGRADLRTFKVINSTHEMFDDAVREAVSKSRYIPAELDRRKVRQLLQQEFGFKLKL